MYQRYTHQELCNAIYAAVASSDKPLSRLEICRKIDRHKSPHILAMIEDLREARYFNCIGETNKWGKQEYRYFVGAKTPEGVCANE